MTMSEVLERLGYSGLDRKYLSDSEIAPAYPMRSQRTAAANMQAIDTEDSSLLVSNPDGSVTLNVPPQLYQLVRSIAERIHELVLLPENWNSYGARPVGRETGLRALVLITQIMTMPGPMPTIVPTVDGGVQFEWHARGVDLEVKVTPSGEVRYYYEDARTSDVEEGDSSAPYTRLRRIMADLSLRLL